MNNNKLTINPGQAVLIQPDDRHEDFYSAGGKLVFFQFSILNAFSKLEVKSIFDKKSVPSHRIIDIAPDSMTEKIVELILKHEKKSEYQLLALGKLCEVFFWNLIDSVPESFFNADFLKIIKRNALFKKIEEYFLAHSNQKLNISAFAKELGISRRALENKFYNLFGNSPSNMFMTMKMNTASGMLKSGMSVKETAEKLGFTDQFYFSTVFKRIMGCPPSKILKK
ncbi:MAG: helix-turn-helix transcriptional regulator [Victivallales bacterium]